LVLECLGLRRARPARAAGAFAACGNSGTASRPRALTRAEVLTGRMNDDVAARWTTFFPPVIFALRGVEVMSMKTHYTLPAKLVVGLMIGAVLTTALWAQSTPPACVVAEVTIHDTGAFMNDYAPKVAGTLEDYGGRFLTSGKLTALEANVPPRF